jgi:hypothetical protein
VSKQYRVIELDEGGFPSRSVVVAVDDAPEDPLDQLAMLVRRLYITVRRNVTGAVTYGRDPIPQYDGGENRWGKTFQPIWPKVAAHIAHHGANPIMYIRCQFHNRKSGEPLVRPNQLYSPAAVERYERYRANVHVTLSSVLEFESTSIRTEVCILEQAAGKRFIKAVEMAIMNTAAVNASALLRFCMAAEYDIPAAIRRWHDEALIQYVFEMLDYDKAWAGWLPTTLQQEGRELMSRMLS